ncbi:MAG TPA: ABC transporter permease subunit, partial [Solirubrobacteraceae bacterium]|nr:ABC transporter permease subunit [Solirubrobacteraceae bacterium]
GASRWYVFRRVIVPAIRPGLIAGAVLAWARALGEFGATITFAGNFSGTTQTTPLRVYLDIASGNEATALALSLVLLVVSLLVLVGLRDRWIGKV